MKIRSKIQFASITGVVITAAVLLSIVMFKRSGLEDKMLFELKGLAHEGVAKNAHDAYYMCKTAYESILKKVGSDLNVARDQLNRVGPVSFSEEMVDWNAVNQYTKQNKNLSLPKMNVGSLWLGQNKQMSTVSPIVDDVKSLVGGTCTIFQKMNAAGDMLRVCTNVEKNDGTRAVGTYIPRTNPDGSPNPVVTTVLNGDTYQGKAFVVNKWYTTAYEPIWNSAHDEVMGILYVGVAQDTITSLREGIMKIVVGKTGYVFVLGGTGGHKGHYIISQDGARDGENIWEAKDSTGNNFIQSIVGKSLKTKDGSVDFEYYPWKNKGDEEARTKVAALTYFEPWDWVIGAGAYEDDFTDTQLQISAAFTSLTTNVTITAIIVVLLVTVFSYLLAKSITSNLTRIVTSANKISGGDIDHDINVTSNDEIGDLALSLEEMVKSMRKSMTIAQQKVDDLNNIPTPVMRIDSDYNVQFMNKTGADLFGMTTEEAEGCKCYDLYKTPHCNTPECRSKIAMETGSIQSAENFVDPEGLNIPVKYISQPVRDKAGKIVGASEFVVDISSEKEAQTGVKNTADILGSVVSEMTSVAGEMGDKSTSISKRANTVASAAEEMSITMNSVSSSAESSLDNINEVATATEEMTSTVAEIAQNSEKARDVSENAVKSVSDASDKMNKLGTAANEISKVIETIVEIAEQTKLLALNATIEAARAGEAGKGFAVVASEVKELAKQTNCATEDIRLKVEAIQNSSESAVDEIGKITSVIGEVNEFVSSIATAVEEQSITTKEISGNIAQASNGITEMTQSVIQSADVAKDVAENINAVNHEINGIKTTTSRLTSTSGDLKNTGESLEEMIAKFR